MSRDYGYDDNRDVEMAEVATEQHRNYPYGEGSGSRKIYMEMLAQRWVQWRIHQENRGDGGRK